MASLPKLLQPFFIRRVYSSFSLYCFRNDTSCPGSNEVKGSGCIVVSMMNTGQQGPVGIAPVFVTHHAESALGRAMIGLIESNDLGTSCYSFGEFHGSFGGLGPAIGKIDGIQRRRQVTG